MFAEKLERMKKILIPTDFTVESLELVEYAILNYPDTKLDIILVAGFRLPEERWAVTHFSSSEQVRRQLTDQFIAAKRRLLLEHRNNIYNLSFELFTGINSCAFQNFLEQHDVQSAIVPNGEMLHYQSNKWFDVTGFLRKNVDDVVEVPMERPEELPQRKFSFIGLFNL
jgi:hypothetical protein